MSLRTIIMTVFSLLMIGLVAWFFIGNWDSIRSVNLVNPSLLWILVGLVAARMTLRGLFHWQVMRSLNVDIPMKEALALNFAGTMMNQLLPMPVGPSFRAVYLKKNYDFPFSLFASTLAALFVYWLMVSATLGLGSATWYYISAGTFDIGVFAILVAVVAGCVTMFVIPKFVPADNESESWLMKRVYRIVTGWRTIVGSKKLIFGASAVVVLSTLVSATAMLISFKIFGIEIEIPGALILMSSQRIGSLIKLTPGAIGYQEMVGVYFTTILAPTAVQATVVFILTRIVNTAVAALAGLPAVWLLSGKTVVDNHDTNLKKADMEGRAKHE